MMTRFLAVLVATGLMVGRVHADTIDDGTLFEQTVAPLITARCTTCHNASDRKGGLDLTSRETLLTGGDSGSALVPGKLDESLLWQRVAGEEMPPKEPLSEKEQSILKDWILRGATWSGGQLDPFRYTTSKRAGYDWWSLQPVRGELRADMTQFAAGPSVANGVDLFVGEKLRAAQLSPSVTAERRTLIRRLYFDLIGLPPDPDEIVAFEHDPSPAAYEQLVDRLLAAPAYGERWARHWLDIARFGESQGFERDKLRTNSWRYRDWVIEAWNRDLPYDEFTRLQLAGDVLRPGDPDALVATGFLVAGPYDEVGQKQQSAAMRAVVREDELEDLVSTISQTFLALTVNCSRCHDHKFDPVRQTEYYRMTANIAGVNHGEPELPGGADTRGASAMSIGAAGRIRALEQRLEAMESPARERLTAERLARRTALQPPRPISAWDFDGNAKDSVGSLHGELRDGAKLNDGMLVLDGKGFVVTPPLPKELREKTLEAWVSVADLNQQGGGVIGVQTIDGKLFDSIVFGEREPRRWVAGSNYFERTQSFQGTEEQAAAERPVHIAIVYHANGTIVGYSNGARYGTEYTSKGPVTFPADKAQVVIGLRHAPPGVNKLLRGAVDRARLYDRALSDDEVAASAGTENTYISENELLAALPVELRSGRNELRFELDQLRQHQSRLSEGKVYAVASQKPAPTFVLIRGNPAQKGESVAPGGIAALRGSQTDIPLPENCSDSDRRRHLTDWVCTERNPLFARVIVNRLWQHHFGVGLVDTPNDFGFNGGRPSHPELLDWLAAELIRSGWSLKRLQRILVTSATYRQSGRIQPEALRVDAGNRLLWRKTPQRLEAETLRDSMLVLAGELNGAMQGPGFYDFTTFTSNSQFYELRDPAGPSFQRRSIYRTWVRSGRSPFLDVFDCPDPSTKTPQRAVTTTPLQALSLFNNSFVLRMADRFAERVARDAGPDVSRQVQRAIELTFGRTPDSEERKLCETLVREHSLSQLCRVLCNSSELLYVD